MIDLVIDRRAHDLGGGFEVGRVLPFMKRRMVGPFIFFDHVGPVDLAPGIPKALDVRPHPHIGLATVTYLTSGQITHRDSLGCHQEIRPHEVNWMVAGSGITHSERFEEARAHGAHMHGLQAWVALPTALEECTPSFTHLAGEAELPVFHADGVVGRLIAGRYSGLVAATPTQSPLFYLHLDMAAGSTTAVSAEYTERAVYIAAGSAEVGDRKLRTGQMAILSPGGVVRVTAEEPATIMLLGGEPLGERHLLWNFVSSSKARLEQAAADWIAGRIKLPVGDDHEFTPLPEEYAARSVGKPKSRASERG
jgi:redox-sensitive bicupin YhaK (pirin superfamily)